jgi:hypothetical protein
MIVGHVSTSRTDGMATRAATVTWAGGSFELRLRGPDEAVDATDDASGFVCTTLPLAMKIGEPLLVEGPVAARLNAHLDDLQAAYLAWNPEWSSIGVTVRGGHRQRSQPSAGTTASFFSRGVDSMCTAAGEGPQALLFADGLEPRHDEIVRAEEIRLAEKAAEMLDQQLLVVETNVRTLTDRFNVDWEDVLGGGLSFIAHGLAATVNRVIIPSSDSFATVEPCGSSPLLDPLMSTERVEIVHGSITLSRLDKVRWLAEHRPEVLALLKVCFAQNRADNCGRCGKCLHTTAALHVAGALDRATLFPDRIDVDRVRGLRLPHLKARIDWAEIARALPAQGNDGRLRGAILDSLRASALSQRYETHDDRRWVRRRFTRDDRLEQTLQLVLEGRPFPPLADDESGTPATLLEVVEGEVRRYRLGTLPHPGEARELGRLVLRPLPGAVPVWLTDDGTVVTRGMVAGRRATRRGRWRWIVAPLRGVGSGRSRGVAALRRARASRRPTLFAPGRATTGAPLGYLHQRPAPDRIPLHAGWHPYLSRFVLGTDGMDVRTKGGEDSVLLGHLDPPIR